MDDTRRRYPRFDCALKVSYSTNGLVSVESETVAEDISKGGIRIPVSRVIKKGDVVRLNIYIDGEDNPISVTGRVRWTDINDAKPRLTIDAGIEFVDINPTEAEKLLSSVK